MSRERFEWLKEIGAEVIATPGCESNVKEIYDKCWEIRRTRPDCVIFNQFEEFGNAAWHYHVTGKMIDEIFSRIARPGDRLAGYVSATGIGRHDRGRRLSAHHAPAHPRRRRPKRCNARRSTSCGFGGHRIEGIGDKHVPWIHNVRNTDMVARDRRRAVPGADAAVQRAGRPRRSSTSEGVAESLIDQLPLVGISGICNLVAAIKTAKYYDMDDRDVIFTCLTDSSSSTAAASKKSAPAAAPTTAPRRPHLRPLPRRHRHRQPARAQLPRPQGDSTTSNTSPGSSSKGASVDDLNRLWDPDFWTEHSPKSTNGTA